MAKTNFTKAEQALEDMKQKRFIESLSELAIIASVVGNSTQKVPKKIAQEMLLRFQNQLKKLKEKDLKLYQRLELSEEKEKKLLIPTDIEQLTPQDWSDLIAFKDKLDSLKKELYGEAGISKEEDQQLIESQRVKHIYKRFNIQDGWLPLH